MSDGGVLIDSIPSGLEIMRYLSACLRAPPCKDQGAFDGHQLVDEVVFYEIGDGCLPRRRHGDPPKSLHIAHAFMDVSVVVLPKVARDLDQVSATDVELLLDEMAMVPSV